MGKNVLGKNVFWGKMSYGEKCHGEICHGEKWRGENCHLGKNVTEPVSAVCLQNFRFADNIIDGSFMGMVLAICLSMVLGAAFFAYKNLYFAVMQKMYPDRGGEL